jgi:hypothetical protein
MSIAWGLNLGHGYVKAVGIDERGEELPPVLFPSQIALGERRSAGAIASAPLFEQGGKHWWAGDDANLGSPRVLLGQERLSDPVFLPVLTKAAYQLAGLPGAGAGIYCVTGLPGSWSDNTKLGDQLQARIKEALPGVFQKILVVAEPEGLALSQLLNSNGEEVGEERYREGRGLIIDLGAHTDDPSLLYKRRKIKGSTRTYQTGMLRALTEIRDWLSAQLGRDFSLHQIDQIVREGMVSMGGGLTVPLPEGWDAPLVQLADQVALRLHADYGNGTDLDYVFLGGWGALQKQKVGAIQALYPFAQIVDDPQLAVARG